ncbi:MAG: alpha-ketoglutarate-dependent dioxygenase AlkB [Saprospiraceae bacterium]|nr:alpha-ketoglutarate-dependent dioxygenase AlkB [Saprospiraceae bacterium]
MFGNQENIELEKAKLVFVHSFFTPSVSDQFLSQLKTEIAWQQGEISLFGRKVLEPRLSAWYGDVGKSYTYSGKKQEPLAWHESLLKVKSAVEAFCQKEKWDSFTPSVERPFNSVLCNFYRNGNDSMGWHQDNEPELGKNPLIASINFGETRRFLFRFKDNKAKKFEILLTHGSLLIMGGEMQHYWQHAVPKEPRRLGERINLTFRHIF